MEGREPMSKMKKILLMLAKGGMSQSAIAAATSSSKRDVSAANKVLHDNSLTFDQVEVMDAAAIDDTFFPKQTRSRNDAYQAFDMEELIERKKRNRKIPVKKFWFEHCELAAANGKLAYSYQTFCEMFANEAERLGVARHFDHEPAAKAYIDWVGDLAWLTDKVTGSRTKVYVLVVCLPFSARFWAGGFTDTKQQSWQNGQAEAFEEFGGTPRMLVPDNCSTATDRGPTYVTLLNKEYTRFAEHYGCAIVPARVRAPRDKNMAESTVDLVEKWIISPSNEMTFYTLEEFNEYCTKQTDWLNERPFSDKEGSRINVYEAEEQQLMNPLPPYRHEICEWRRAKVAPDYHVRIDYMHYSVPYRLIGQFVDVKMLSGKVELIHEGEVVATHRRLHGRKNQYSTVVDHMPENHREQTSPWSPERFESWSAKIGPETSKAISKVLAGKTVVEQAFVPCRNILGLSKSYTPALLERACSQLNAFSATPSYTALKHIIQSIKADEDSKKGVDGAMKMARSNDAVLVDRADGAGRTRGADAYRREGGRPC